MGLFDSLAEFYDSLEEKYRALCDSLQEKGISIYDFFVDPLESHGIPSFPIFILLILLLFGGLFYLLAGAPPSQADLIVIVESNGSRVDAAIVMLLQDDKAIFTNSTRNGSLAFVGIPKGKYTVSVSKEGYNPTSKTVDLNKENLVLISLSCSTGDCGRGGNKPTIPVQPLIPSVEPTALPPITFHDAEKGSLSIFCHDQQNRLVDAVVKVFNDKSGVELATVKLSAGHGSIDNLDAGTRVYMTAQADGYLSFSDRTKTWVVEGGLNVATILLTAISGNSSNSSSNPNYNTSWILVKNSQGTGLANVEVQVFKNDGSGSAIIFGKYTNANGVVSADLSRSVTVGFYATASKTNYFINSSVIFQPGQNTSITLYPTTDSNGVVQQANLAVTVLDEFSQPVDDAIVAAHSQAASIITPLGNKQTDFDGKAFFTGLAPMQTVVVNATKGTRIGQAMKLLVVGDNDITVSLLLNTGFLNLSAYDAVSGDIIPAHFNASFDVLSFEQCDGASCSIEVRSDVDVSVTASAEGYEPHTFSIRVAADQVKTELVWLVQEGVVADSLVSFQGLFDSQGRRVINAYPGRTYSAKFRLLTKNADLSGMHFAVDPSIAWINSVYPPSAVLKASEAAGCAGLNNFAEGKKYVWMDLTYGGDRNLEISFNITIKPDVPLDLFTHSANLTLSYRSFIKRGDAWIRNPFDYVLLAKEDAPLASGCYASAYSEIIPIVSPQMTCNNFGCVTMEFIQAGRVGPHQNFTALSMLNINPESASYAPVVVNYRIELYQPLSESSFLRFSQDQTSLLATDVSLPFKEPLADGWLCENNANKMAINDYSFVADTSNLASCLNYAADLISIYSPFSFSGEILLKPVASSNSTYLTLELSSGNQTISHSATVSVVDPNYAETEYANLSLIVSQPQSPSTDQDDPYNAFISLPPLNISFGVGIKKFALSHYITLTSSEGSRLNITSASVFVKRGSQAPVASNITLDAFGRGIIAFKGTTLEPGDFVYGVASAIPQKAGSSALVVLDNATISGAPAISFLMRNINVLTAEAPTSGLSFERISQLQDGVLKEISYPASQSDVFPAFTLDACTNCGYGNVMLDYAIPVSVDVPKARFKLTASENFEFASATAVITHYDLTESEIAFGSSGTQEFAAKAGDVIRGSIELVPSAVGEAQVALSFEGGMVPASASANFIIDYRPAAYQPPGQLVSDWILAGNCQKAELSSDPSALSIDCGNVTLRVSSVFPADGIQVVVSSSSQSALTVKTIAENPAGISNCFQSCDAALTKCYSDFRAFSTPGISILRFNPLANANCPLQPIGNKAPEGSITLKVWRSGLGEIEADGQNLNIKIMGSGTPKSLYAAPITPQFDANKQFIHNIELWVLVNNRQFGERTITVNNIKLFSFDGPGVQTFVLPKGQIPVVRESDQIITDAVGDRRILQSVYDALSGVTKLANKTAYWRGSENQLWWCDEQLGECRSSLEDWKNVTYYYESTQTNCVFCNNSQGTPCSDDNTTIYPTCATSALGQVRNCDDRCQPINPNELATDSFDSWIFDNYYNHGWKGVAVIDYGKSFDGKTCATTMKGKSNASVFEFEKCKQDGLCVENSTFMTVNGVDYVFCFGDSNGNGFIDEAEADSINVSKTRVNNGVTEYYCMNASTKFIIENNSCAFQCAAASPGYSSGWCGPDEETATALGVAKSCDIQCPAKGYSEVQGDLVTSQGVPYWFNKSQLIVRQSNLIAVRYAPFYYFRDYQGMQNTQNIPVFEFHAPSDAQSYASVLFSLQDAVGASVQINTVSGCPNNDGFYDFKEYNPGTLWTVDASVLELKKTFYLDPSAQCKKDAASWSQLKLCHPVYTDSSTAYGKCFNSLPINFPDAAGAAFLRAPQPKSRKTGVFQVSNDGNVVQATSLVGPDTCTAVFQWYSPITVPNTLTFHWESKPGKKLDTSFLATLGVFIPELIPFLPVLDFIFSLFSFGKKSCAKGKPTCKSALDSLDSGHQLAGPELIYACTGKHPPDWGISSHPPSR